MATIGQITRLLLIIRRIKSRRFITTKNLLEYINDELSIRDYPSVSLRSIERDIETIRGRPFGINIAYTAQKGYRIEESDFIGIDIEQLLEPFDILNALNADTGLSDIIITEKYSYKGTEHLYQLIAAIRKCLRVTFDYVKYSLEGSSVRVLEPYNIKQFKGQWYLIGKVPGSNEIKTFGLDRIHDLKTLKQSFTKVGREDVSTKFKHSYGIYSSDEYPIEDVVLSFDKVDGSYLKSVPLHSSQEVLKESGSEFIIKLRLRLTEDFVMAIVSRSWSLKVIQPSSLRERVCNIYRDALLRNSDQAAGLEIR